MSVTVEGMTKAVLLCTQMEEEYAKNEDWDHLKKISEVKRLVIEEQNKKKKGGGKFKPKNS